MENKLPNNEKPFSIDMGISNNIEDSYVKKLQDIVNNRENDEDYHKRIENCKELNEYLFNKFKGLIKSI